MFKQIIFTVVVIAACALSAQATETDSACLSQVSSYLGSFQVNPRVQVLVDEMRKFFPSFETIFERMPQMDYIKKMYAIGVQPGCVELLAHVKAMRTNVPCFENGLASNEVIQIAKSDENISKILESTYACISSGNLSLGL